MLGKLQVIKWMMPPVVALLGFGMGVLAFLIFGWCTWVNVRRLALYMVVAAAESYALFLLPLKALQSTWFMVAIGIGGGAVGLAVTRYFLDNREDT